MSQDKKNRVLVLARKSKFSELDQLLQSEGLHWTECRYPSGDTPLHTAAQRGNINIIQYLLAFPDTDSKTVDVTNLAGKTALHEACQNSQPAAVSLLISKGANVRAIKQADWTPLMLACTKTGENAHACCRILLESDGPVLLEDRNKDGWNALHIAAREGDTSIVKTLLMGDFTSKQASIKSNNGRTPLHTAALHGCHLIVTQLLNFGSVDCDAKDSCGSTPLHDSVRSGSLATFQALVGAGADLRIQNHEGYGVLHMAAQAGQIQMLEYLLKEIGIGPTIGSDTNFKTTPLHCAVRAGQVESTAVLLSSGAEPDLLDAWGRSSYDIIPEKNVIEIKSVLNSIKR